MKLQVLSVLLVLYLVSVMGQERVEFQMEKEILRMTKEYLDSRSNFVDVVILSDQKMVEEKLEISFAVLEGGVELFSSMVMGVFHGDRNVVRIKLPSQIVTSGSQFVVQFKSFDFVESKLVVDFPSRKSIAIAIGECAEKDFWEERIFSGDHTLNVGQMETFSFRPRNGSGIANLPITLYGECKMGKGKFGKIEKLVNVTSLPKEDDEIIERQLSRSYGWKLTGSYMEDTTVNFDVVAKDFATGFVLCSFEFSSAMRGCNDLHPLMNFKICRKTPPMIQIKPDFQYVATDPYAGPSESNPVKWVYVPISRLPHCEPSSVTVFAAKPMRDEEGILVPSDILLALPVIVEFPASNFDNNKQVQYAIFETESLWPGGVFEPIAFYYEVNYNARKPPTADFLVMN